MGVHVDEYNELVDALQVSKSIALPHLHAGKDC